MARNDSAQKRENLSRNLAALSTPKVQKTSFFSEVGAKVRDKLILTVLGGILTLIVMDLGRREIKAYDQNLADTRAAIEAVNTDASDILSEARALVRIRRGHMQNLYNHFRLNRPVKFVERYAAYDSFIVDYGAKMASLNTKIRRFARCIERADQADPIFSAERRAGIFAAMRAREAALREDWKERVDLEPAIPKRMWDHFEKPENFCPSLFMTGRASVADPGKTDAYEDRGRMFSAREVFSSAHLYYRRHNEGAYMTCTRDYLTYRDAMANACFRADTLEARSDCLKEFRIEFTAENFCASEEDRDLKVGEPELLDMDFRWILGEMLWKETVRPNALLACEATLANIPRWMGYECEALVDES